MTSIIPFESNQPSVAGNAAEMWLSRFPKHTARAYRRDLLDFATFSKIPLMDLHQINLNLVFMRAQDWLNGLTEHPASRARKASALRSYFDFLANLRLIDSNPLRYLHTGRVNHRPREVLTGEEVEGILESIDRSTLTGQRNYCIVSMLAELGLRRHELTSLKVGSLSKSADGRTILTVLGKGEKQRVLPLSRGLCESLNTYLTAFGVLSPNDPLFRNPEGRALSDNLIYEMVQRYADRADINKTISPHSFRHFAVTEATRSGSQAVEIQSLTGHAYVDTVAQYTHLNQVETVEEIQKRRGYEY